MAVAVDWLVYDYYKPLATMAYERDSVLHWAWFGFFGCVIMTWSTIINWSPWTCFLW